MNRLRKFAVARGVPETALVGAGRGVLGHAATHLTLDLLDELNAHGWRRDDLRGPHAPRVDLLVSRGPAGVGLALMAQTWALDLRDGNPMPRVSLLPAWLDRALHRKDTSR